jgi:hypothetical protein
LKVLVFESDTLPAQLGSVASPPIRTHELKGAYHMNSGDYG